jgi:hypothetical protein
MSNADALNSAVALLHVPSRVRSMRSSPLPQGTNLLLRLAAGEVEALTEAQRLNGRAPEVSRDAAVFFIEQILLSADADSYRILGLEPTAPIGELRSHMALLLKWLHPDISRDGHKSLLAQRVIRAWDQVKTPDRRRSYDEQSGVKADTSNGQPSRAGSLAKPKKFRGFRKASDPKRLLADPRRGARKVCGLRKVFAFLLHRGGRRG